MANDIFNYNRNVTPEAIFSADMATLTIMGKSSDGALIQNWQLSYQQNIDQIFELGSSNVYWVRGRPQGQGAIGTMVRGSVSDWPSEMYDVCSGGATMAITAAPGLCEGSDATFSLSLTGVIVSGVNVQSQVGAKGISSNQTLRFSSLSW